jgi:hypothetical protein
MGTHDEAPLHCFNPGQPAGKGRKKKKPWSRYGFQDLDRREKKKKKKTLVLTLGSPPKKGGKKKKKKKTPGPDLAFRTSNFKTWTDGKKKTLVLILGSPPKKGKKKKNKQTNSAGSAGRKRCQNVARRKGEKKKPVPVLP